MTRTEYLAQLHKYLQRIPEADYQEAMDYFVEYFEEAGPENEEMVIAELGTPKEAASEIIASVLGKQVTDPNKKPKTNATIIGMIVLSIFAAPIALPILIALVLLLLGIVLFLLAIVTMAYLLGIASLFLATITLFESFTLLSSSLPAMSFGIGISLLFFGGALLIWLLTTLFARYSGKGIVILWQKIIRRRRTA